MYTRDSLDQLKSQISLVDVVRAYTTLTEKGEGKFLGSCPFPDHRDSSPSFHVNDEQGFFKCFGCQRGGDIFELIKQLDGLDFNEAVEALAERYGFSLQRTGGDPELSYQSGMFADMQKVTNIFQTTNVNMLKAFCLKRQVGRSLAEKFLLGYAPADLDYEQATGLSQQRLIELGVLRTTNGEVYPQFRNKIMFPIRNEKGKIIGYMSRVFGQELPKYVNSVDTAIFRRRETLYGLYEALPVIRKRKSVIVVEGTMDVLAMWKAGYQNAVACLGSFLTPEHVEKLAKRINTIILCFDGDAAGQKSLREGIKACLTKNLTIGILCCPNGQDPDEIALAEGPLGLQKFVSTNVLGLMEWMKKEEAKFKPDQITERTNFLNWCVQISENIGDPIQRMKYIEALITYLNLPRNLRVPEPKTITQTPPVIYITRLSSPAHYILQQILLGKSHPSLLQSLNTAQMPWDEQTKQIWNRMALWQQLPTKPIMEFDNTEDKQFIADLLSDRWDTSAYGRYGTNAVQLCLDDLKRLQARFNPQEPETNKGQL